MNNKAILWIVTVAAVAMVAAAFLLTAVFGPSDNGLRCARTPGLASCQVRQTRLLGISGNSSFLIPEANIREAKAACATTKVGGRAAPSCNVYLSMVSGQEYPVLSYQLQSQAAVAAKKLNDYFEDRSARSVEIKEDLVTPVLLSGAAPVLFAAVLFGLRKWRLSD